MDVEELVKFKRRFIISGSRILTFPIIIMFQCMDITTITFRGITSAHLLLLIRIKSKTVVLYLERGPKFLLINLSILRWNLSKTYLYHITCNTFACPQLMISDQEICKVFNDKELLHQGSKLPRPVDQGYTKRIIKLQHLHYISGLSRRQPTYIGMGWMDKTIKYDWTNTYIYRGPVLTKHAAKDICI